MSVQNTAYIRLAVDSEARVRPLLLAIRYLAKHHGLAGGGGGMRMSSYALTMIAITFLQQRAPVRARPRPRYHQRMELQFLQRSFQSKAATRKFLHRFPITKRYVNCLF